MDAESMARFGSNGSLIVEYLKDRVGPTQEVPNIVFNIYVIAIHWHTVQPIIDDD